MLQTKGLNKSQGWVAEILAESLICNGVEKFALLDSTTGLSLN